MSWEVPFSMCIPEIKRLQICIETVYFRFPVYICSKFILSLGSKIGMKRKKASSCKREVKLNFERRTIFTFKLNLVGLKHSAFYWKPLCMECICNSASPNSFYMLGRGKAEIRAKFQRVSKESKVTLYSELYSNLA